MRILPLANLGEGQDRADQRLVSLLKWPRVDFGSLAKDRASFWSLRVPTNDPRMVMPLETTSQIYTGKSPGG